MQVKLLDFVERLRAMWATVTPYTQVTHFKPLTKSEYSAKLISLLNNLARSSSSAKSNLSIL